MTALTASDYRGALDVLRVAHESEGPLSLGADVMAALRRVIPSVMATYHEWEPSRGYAWVLDGADPADVQPIWSRYDDVREQDPLPARAWGCDRRLPAVGAAIRFADVLTLRQFRRLDLHAEVCRPLGVDHVMKLFLAVGDAGFGYIVLDSERRAFSDRDRSLLDVLAPHLALVRERHLRLAERSLDPAVAASLTAREEEILRLVATGMTNREVAGALFISPGTVRKHLENAYAKLGVRSRAQAVAVLARGSDLFAPSTRSAPSNGAEPGL